MNLIFMLIGIEGEVRGCAAAENAYQVANSVGCGHSGHTVLCLCDTYLCNGSLCPTSISLSLLTFCLIFVYFNTFLP
jgi:hypothetical protein